MSQESVEYLLRQQSKVRTPKTLVKVVRQHTRELRRQRKSETDRKAIEVLGEVSKELIRGGTSIASSIAQAHATAAGAWLGSDPISWAGGAAVAYAYLSWIIFLGNKIVISTDKEGHVTTLSDKLGIPFLRDILPKTVLDTVDVIVDKARDWSQGTIIGSPDEPDAPPPTPTPVTTVTWNVQSTGGRMVWFTDKAAAEQHFFLTTLTIGLIRLAQGAKVYMVERTTTFINGLATDTRDKTVKIWP